MPYNTGNALGSTDPKDLFDNAQNFDYAINDDVNPTFVDRLGKVRSTLKGYDEAFQNFLINSGYQSIGDYAAGLVITARNQTFWRAGLVYRIGNETALPYTTTGVWATEQSLFVIVGDADLQQEVDQLRTDVDALTTTVGGKANAGLIQSSGLTSASGVLWGRFTADVGPLEPVTIGANLSVVGGVLTATGGATPQERQNSLLNWIYQSKLYAGYRRGIRLFADGYKSTDGINAGLSSNYSVDTANGRLVSTRTEPQIPQATGIAIGTCTGSGGLSAAFDGVTSQTFVQGAYTPTNVNNGYIGKNYSAAPKRISKVTMYGCTDSGFDGTASSSTITIVIRGKNGSAPTSRTDGTSIGTWTGLDANSIVQTITSTDLNTLWDYVWADMSTTATYVGVAEIQFFEAVTNNLTAITTAQTVPSSTKGRALIEYDAALSPVLNTDLTIDISANNGGNWTAASLASVGTGQSGRLVAETSEVTLIAGTSLIARVRTFNNKYVPIHGLTLTSAD